MVIIRKKEIKSLSTSELLSRLESLEQEALKLRVQKGQPATGNKGREIRKTIARIKTQFNQPNQTQIITQTKTSTQAPNGKKSTKSTTQKKQEGK